LLVAATLVYYALGRALEKAASRESGEKAAKALSITGITVGIALLLYFKYLNFFIESALLLFSRLGINADVHVLNIVMPLGVSYWTFKLLSYVIEIDRKKITAEKSLIDFALYISFFPTITAGPIDRPHFISQLKEARTFDYNRAVDGCRQILWGLYKKFVIADIIAQSVDVIWGNVSSISGANLIISGFLFFIQLYADFSGYSDIAIGLSKLLGLNVTRNFNYPFFSRNIAEFWRNWHCSLTSWLTEYVFIPLSVNFRNLGKMGTILALIINFLFVGLWHSANWTFVIFGLIQGLLFIPLVLGGTLNKKLKPRTSRLGFSDFASMIGIFILMLFCNMIIRAKNISQFVDVLERIVLHPFPASIFGWNVVFLCLAIFSAFLMVILDFCAMKKNLDHSFRPEAHVLLRVSLFRRGLYIFMINAILATCQQGAIVFYAQF
jgi:D-alanyl-lipoteichoic acid acyltransferase DltB (MBOAT superfamily)